MKPTPEPGTLEALNLTFKKRFRKARPGAEEAVVRAEWQAAKQGWWATHAATSIEELDRYYSDKLASVERDEDKAAVRLAWASSKADHYERLYKLNGASGASPASVEEPAEDPIEAARRAYGDPAAASGAMGSVYADPPMPIEVHWPTVQTITVEEGT